MSGEQPPVPRRRPKRAVTGNNLASGDGQREPFTGLYADPNYATNLCPNPSFEVSAAGWTATDGGTSLSVTSTVLQANPTQQVTSPVVQALYGQQCLQVTTNGAVPGQGAIGPQGSFPLAPGNAAMTASVFGETGTVQVSFVNASGGTVLGSQTLTLTGSGWQTVVVQNVPFQPAAQLYALFQTVGPQAITFFIDGVMYQPEGNATAYVDGDQPNCFWTGTPELSTSYQPFQFAISGTLRVHLSGFCTAIASGATTQVTNTPVLIFSVDPQPGALASAGTIAGAFTDFGIWTATDPDPAMTYGWWTNAGTSSSQTGYQQIYGMVVPPLDYQVSGGQYAWRRAAYAAVGFSWASVPTGIEQILTDVQLEYAQTTVGSATTPSAYQRARQLQVIIRPSRLNYATNPAFQIGTAGWSQIGSTVTMQVRTDVWPANIATYDNLPFGAFQSCLVTLNGSADSGIQLSVPFLIPGQTYMASCYVMAQSNGLADLLGSCGGGAADVAGLIEPQFSYGGGGGIEGYGQGPYGGILASNTPLPTGVWTRLSFSFVAATDTQVFQVAAEYIGGGNAVITPLVYPQQFFVTGVLIEPGDILQSYFDGNSGPDAVWEYAGGTTTPVPNGGTLPGQSRSYYYKQLQFGQSIVSQTLQSNTPLGISYAAPLYATPPLQ